MGVLFGIIISLIFLTGYYFQLLTARKEDDLSGVSILFWFLISLATMVTFGNLWETHAEWYVIVPQFLNASIALLILLLVTYKKEGKYALWVVSWVYAFLGFVFVYLTPNDFIQHSASGFIIMAYIDQIINIIAKKDVSGINPKLFIAFAIGLGLMAFNIIHSGALISAAFTEISNLVMILICLGLVLKYKNKNVDNKNI